LLPDDLKFAAGTTAEWRAILVTLLPKHRLHAIHENRDLIYSSPQNELSSVTDKRREIVVFTKQNVFGGLCVKIVIYVVY
jgi:hypothetical protein